MAAKFREAQDDQNSPLAPNDQTDTQADKPVRPDHVPEKFWNAETGEVNVDGLLKSYAELEAGKGKKTDEVVPPQIKEGEGAAEEAVTNAGLNWDDLGSKIGTKGDIDETDYEALAKVGVPKEIVQEFIQLRKGAVDRAAKEANDYGGGTEAVAGMLDWAAKNLSQEEITGYNTMLAGPSWKVAMDTLKALQAKASPTNGEPNLVTAKGHPGGTTVGYQTEDEMHADMREPLYREMSPKGEAFRKQVSERTRLAAYRRAR
ncbi:MAG: hypothetical protein P4M09_17305 [Devosia sp.]|nr:hypothetical protein [Devosia sp.]